MGTSLPECIDIERLGNFEKTLRCARASRKDKHVRQVVQIGVMPYVRAPHSHGWPDKQVGLTPVEVSFAKEACTL